MRRTPAGAGRRRLFDRGLLAGLCVFSLCAGATPPVDAGFFPDRIEIPSPLVPNTLSEMETAAGWRLLFDGQSPVHWRAARGNDFPEDGWSTEDGVLQVRAAGPFEFRAGGDLFSRERFRDFLFDFEFQLSEGANSGVKYRAEVQRQWGFVHSLGCEYQLLDDERHPDARRGRNGNRRLASLYDLIPADARRSSRSAEPKSFRGIETWNHGRVHVEKGRIAHYLNGEKVLSVQIDSEDWKRAVAGSKFADRPTFCDGQGGKGHLVLQDHGDTARFRNLRIRTLD